MKKLLMIVLLTVVGTMGFKSFQTVRNSVNFVRARQWVPMGASLAELQRNATILETEGAKIVERLVSEVDEINVAETAKKTASAFEACCRELEQLKSLRDLAESQLKAWRTEGERELEDWKVRIDEMSVNLRLNEQRKLTAEQAEFRLLLTDFASSIVEMNSVIKQGRDIELLNASFAHAANLAAMREGVAGLNKEVKSKTAAFKSTLDRALASFR